MISLMGESYNCEGFLCRNHESQSNWPQNIRQIKFILVSSNHGNLSKLPIPESVCSAGCRSWNLMPSSRVCCRNCWPCNWGPGAPPDVPDVLSKLSCFWLDICSLCVLGVDFQQSFFSKTCQFPRVSRKKDPWKEWGSYP